MMDINQYFVRVCNDTKINGPDAPNYLCICFGSSIATV